MKIALSEDVQKQCNRLPKAAQIKIYKKLEVLGKNPYSGKKLGGELANFWSLRVWPYRVIYEINQKANRIDIHKIAHRQGVYT